MKAKLELTFAQNKNLDFDRGLHEDLQYQE